MLPGRAAVLDPVAEDMGTIAGYVVADYLLQHATRARRYERAPAGAWEALLPAPTTTVTPPGSPTAL